MDISSLSTASGGLSTLLTPAGSTSRGLTLGRFSERDDADAAPTLSTRISGTSDTFAAVVMDKLQAAQTASNAGALVTSGAAGDLQDALAEAVNYVREKHGDAAATAMMGIVLKGVGDGSGGEDALGDALVSSLKFIDRNFGIASGDAAIATFNGALNDAVNGYFQNGHEELFYASDGSGGATGQIQSALSATLDMVGQRFGEDTAKAVSDVMTDSLEKTGVNRRGLGTALSAADAYLQNAFGEEAGLATATQTLPPDALPTLAKGSVLDQAV